MNKQTSISILKAINRNLKKMRAFDGGRSYGVDWPTWNMTFPHRARVFRQIACQVTGQDRNYMPNFNY